MGTFDIFGIIGVAIIAVAVWIKNERKQDGLFALGGLFLLAYSIYINNAIFIVLQAIFTASALIELFKLNKK